MIARAWKVVALSRAGDESGAARERETLSADLARAASPGLTPYERGLLALEPSLREAAGLYVTRQDTGRVPALRPACVRVRGW